MPFATDQERALANLLVSVMNSREQEGARVSRILHDEVGQVLSAVGLQLDLVRMDVKDDPAAATQRISDVQRMLEKAICHIRDLSYELNPCVVERAGLQAALDRLVSRHRADHTGAVRLMYDHSVRLPGGVATAVYKIAEQALDNAVRHSGASTIDVIVKMGKGSELLEVRDDGQGFEPNGSRGEAPGLGLHLMRHYAVEAGLRFALVSAPGKGTIVRAIHKGSSQVG
ncbi:MAG TPA: histidine kinase [Bryobacteraceae bacterium]|nr:histidine kinase [Bryobacteraceae bacterium]